MMFFFLFFVFFVFFFGELNLITLFHVIVALQYVILDTKRFN